MWCPVRWQACCECPVSKNWEGSGCSLFEGPTVCQLLIVVWSELCMSVFVAVWHTDRQSHGVQWRCAGGCGITPQPWSCVHANQWFRLLDTDQSEDTWLCR